MKQVIEQEMKAVSPQRKPAVFPTQSPIRERTKHMFVFQKDTIERINRVKCARNMSPNIHSIKYNPRDHHASPMKQLKDIEKLLAETSRQTSITYKDPMPKFRSAKNSPYKDYERKMLYV